MSLPTEGSSSRGASSRGGGGNINEVIGRMTFVGRMGDGVKTL